ncbi:MAG: MaoC/PaaZ C-terminal domain-containing protein [Caulobacteraceae bacterium]|nr:MaoC/PaaZ C-terminal domain-containing protein [Caulobacteraceae bacterium]
MITCVGLTVGARLPDLRIPISAKTIVMGAAASRDWQPQHHDSAWARDSAGLPDIIMNNYTQAGFFCRYVTDWSGPDGRIGRFKFAMKKPICPGDEILLQGVVEGVLPSVNGYSWVDIIIKALVDGALATSAEVRLALPNTASSPSPWRCARALWAP